MKLKLPILSTPISTLKKWATLFNQSDFVINQSKEDLTLFDSEITGGGGMVVVPTLARCGFLAKLFPWIYLEIRATIVSSSVAGGQFYATFPKLYPCQDDTGLGPVFTCVGDDNGLFVALTARREGQKITIRRFDSANFTLGANTIYLSGWYKTIS